MIIQFGYLVDFRVPQTKLRLLKCTFC